VRGFERGGGIFLGARSLLTRATVSAAVCATRRAASAAASAATRRVLAAAAAATASSRRRRASSVSTRAVCASARRCRARSTASRATRSRLGSRGARGGGSGCAARGSRSERRRASGRCGWRGGSGRGASPRRLGAGRSPRAEEFFGAGMVLVDAAAVAVAAARVFARVASLDMRARRASASARRRASSLRTRGGFEGGRCSTGTSSSRWSVTTKPRSPSPVSIQDGTRFGSPARMSRRVRRRAAPRQSSCARPAGSPFETLPRGCQHSESPENLNKGKQFPWHKMAVGRTSRRSTSRDRAPQPPRGCPLLRTPPARATRTSGAPLFASTDVRPRRVSPVPLARRVMSTDDALELGGLPGAPPPPKPTPRTTPVMRPGDVVLLEMTGPNGDKWSFVNLKRDQCVPPPAPRAFAPARGPDPGATAAAAPRAIDTPRLPLASQDRVHRQTPRRVARPPHRRALRFVLRGESGRHPVPRRARSRRRVALRQARGRPPQQQVHRRPQGSARAGALPRRHRPHESAGRARRGHRR